MIGRWTWSPLSFNLLYSLRLRRGDEDKICWIPSKRRMFKVRSFYHALSFPTCSFFPWKGIWRNEAPSRVTFFVWIIREDFDYEWPNRHVILVNWCYMCKKSEKAIDHLLLYYEVARNFTVLVFCLFGMEWVMPQRVVEFLVDWRDKLGSHRKIVVWKMVPLCLMWYIWRECNA